MICLLVNNDSIPDPELNVGSTEVAAVASTVKNNLISNLIKANILTPLGVTDSSDAHLTTVQSIGVSSVTPILKAYLTSTRYPHYMCVQYG